MTVRHPLRQQRVTPAAIARPVPVRGLLWTWTGTVAAGEALGFVFPASAGVAAQSLPTALAVAVLLAAGAVEGFFLGAAQQAVIRRALPELEGGRWIVLTATAAVAAYALGFVLSYLGGVRSWVVVLPIVATAVLLLATMGGAQAIELRRHVRRAHLWVVWTGLGWLAALATFLLIATPLWHVGKSATAAIGVGVLVGVAMALVQAAVTGRGLLIILATSPSSNRRW